MKNTSTGWQRLLAATRYSWQGLRSAYNGEAAFRQEVWLAIIAVPLALFVGQTALERGLLLSSILLLLIVELLNSAIEAVVDRCGEEYHPLSGRAKDMGSAAVLLTLLLVIIIWISVLL